MDPTSYVRMGARHNKKRNPLLILEFLTKEASKRLVAGDEAGSCRVLDVIGRAFAAGTELHREYRLANALLIARVSSPNVAVRVLDEARSAARAMDPAKLDREKTELIAEIARDIDRRGVLYETQLSDYRDRATVGTLLVDWRSSDPDLSRLAAYEDRLVEHLTRPVVVTESTDVADGLGPGERRAVISVMSRKLEERWGKTLSREQRSLLREYAVGGDDARLLRRLREDRERSIRCIDERVASAETSDYHRERLAESKRKILARPIERVDDDAVGMGMLYLELIAAAASEAEGEAR